LLRDAGGDAIFSISKKRTNFHRVSPEAPQGKKKKNS